MTIIPAIDILNGACVRLYRGDYSKTTVYANDPLEQAMRFKAAGARRIHIVDLNAARGEENNRDIIRKLCGAVDAEIEVGGGIRSEQDAEELCEAGVDRLVVGTSFARDPSILEGWTKRFGRRFIAGIDAIDGEVRVSGWEKSGGMKAVDLAARAADAGAVSIIYTNIQRDGTLEGPDIEGTCKIAQKAGIPAIVSGGVKGEEDFKQLFNQLPRGIAGVIVGKALYEKRFDLKRVLALYQSEIKKDEEKEVW